MSEEERKDLHDFMLKVEWRQRPPMAVSHLQHLHQHQRHSTAAMAFSLLPPVPEEWSVHSVNPVQHQQRQQQQVAPAMSAAYDTSAMLLNTEGLTAAAPMYTVMASTQQQQVLPARAMTADTRRLLVVWMCQYCWTKSINAGVEFLAVAILDKLLETDPAAQLLRVALDRRLEGRAALVIIGSACLVSVALFFPQHHNITCFCQVITVHATTLQWQLLLLFLHCSTHSQQASMYTSRRI
jgi:hypothetical protein